MLAFRDAVLRYGQRILGDVQGAFAEGHRARLDEDPVKNENPLSATPHLGSPMVH